MKLALSGRLFESRNGYTLDLEAFLRFARDCGCEGVEIRYPQLPLETSASRLDEVKGLLGELGLTWVFGAVEGIVGEPAFERAARMLDLHQRAGCRFTRFIISQPDQVVWAQRFADEAALRGRRLVTQIHCGTLADNVPHALETLERIARPNVGLIYEACHLRFDGDERHAQAVRSLASRIHCVALQNYKPASPADPKETVAEIKGRAYVRALPGDPAGIDFPAVFSALREIGFDGFATVMADAMPGMDSRELAGRYIEMCRQSSMNGRTSCRGKEQP
jgi:sugar phosphate isomerase/epimerase